MDKILYTQRLILRPLCVGDLVSAYAYSGDPENTRYMLWFDKTPADTERFLRGAETEWRKEKPKSKDAITNRSKRRLDIKKKKIGIGGRSLNPYRRKVL